MILRKKIEEGKETYEKISFNEATKLDKSELVFTTEDEEDEYDDFLEEKEDKIDGLDDKLDDLNDQLDNIEDELDDLNEKGGNEEQKESLKAKRAELLNLISSLKKEMKAFANAKDKDVNIAFDFKFKGDDKNIFFLLPFLGKEKVQVIAKEKLAGNPKYEKIDLSYLLPFMSKEANDEIFMSCLKDKTYAKELFKFAPFVSKSSLDYLCDEYCKGNLDYIDINKFYPFMSKESINKIFDYYLSK